MNQRLSDSAAAPAVYKAMLALQASVDKSGLEKDLMDPVPVHFTFRRSCHALCGICREAPVSECAGCHMANVAKTDMTWVQFYSLLHDK